MSQSYRCAIDVQSNSFFIFAPGVDLCAPASSLRRNEGKFLIKSVSSPHPPNSGNTTWNANWPTNNTNWSSSDSTFTGATPAAEDNLIFSYTPSWGTDTGKFLNTPAGQARTMTSLSFGNNVAVIRQNGSQAQAALNLGAGGLTLASSK
jgi:hypothetical protein